MRRDGSLNRLELDTLYALAAVEPADGQLLHKHLTDDCETTQSYLYTVLETLQEAGHVGRTNERDRDTEFYLTSGGRLFLRRDAQRRYAVVEQMGPATTPAGGGD